MKKLVLIMIFAMAIFNSANSKTIYVSSSGDDTDGSSWASAYTSLSNANLNATDGDNIYIKGGIYNFSTTFSTIANVNYYGGFEGLSDSETPESRSTSDIDGNGIIEPFEFANPSIINFTISSNVPGLNIVANASLCVFDGFVIKGTYDFGTLTSGNVSNCIRIGNNASFRNNRISDLAVSGTINSASCSNNGTLLYISGVGSTVDNCLFENNSSTITGGASQGNVWQSPFIHIAASSTSARNVFSNNILRNNRVVVDFSNTSLATNSLTRGMLLSTSMLSSATTFFNTIKNTVIYNNELTYIPMQSTPHQLANGGILYVPNGNLANSDSIIHCTIANNKMNRVGYAIRAMFQSTSLPYHVVANNALYNNMNFDGTSTTVQNLYLTQKPVTTGTGILIANNIMNGGLYIVQSGGNNGSTVIDNLTDLADTNTGTNPPLFSNPTINTGYFVLDESVKEARWTIQNNSYLKSKGINLSSYLTDKSGHDFANPRSVGAYEKITYNVSVSINGNGSVNGDGNVDYGSYVNLNASPDLGNLFENWTLGESIVSTSTNFSFLPTENVSLTANFVIDTTTNDLNLYKENVLILKNRTITVNDCESIEIYSTVGNLLFKSSNNHVSYPINEKGIYLVRLKIGNNMHVQKIHVD